MTDPYQSHELRGTSQFVSAPSELCFPGARTTRREAVAGEMSGERDWSVFIGERLNAPWTSDRAGAALMPEHLRQVVSATLLAASPQWSENTSRCRGPVACSKVEA